MRSRDSWSDATPQERELLARCKAAVTAVAADAEVVLYGSRARGEAGEHSDYDLLVLAGGPVDTQEEDRIRSALYPLELESGAVITLIAFSRTDWDSPVYRAMPFRRNVEREGVVL